MAEATKKSGAKRGASRKGSKSQAIGGFIWLGIGLLVGLFVAFLVFLQTRNDTKQKSATDVAAVESKKQGGDASSAEPPMSFDFYKRLPKIEVTVPENKNSKTPPQPDSAPAAKNESNKANSDNAYIVQVGSFKRYEDADRHKANLALLGISSKIVPFSKENETWHRVQIGPIKNNNELNEVKTLLSERNINAIVVKVRG